MLRNRIAQRYLLVMVLCLFLAACGSNNNGETDNTTEGNDQVAEVPSVTIRVTSVPDATPTDGCLLCCLPETICQLIR